MGLKFSRIEARSEAGIGLRSPKKVDGEGARDAGRAPGVDTGLETALGVPPGLKELAAGFGLNSAALILNLEDTAEVGVRTLLGVCDVEIGAAFAVERFDVLEAI